MISIWTLLPLSPASRVEAAPLPIYVTIVEDLPLYDAPSMHALVEGAIGPQTIQVLDTKETDGRKWFLVNTWLGSKWISPNFDYQGALKKTEPFDIQLYEDNYLYNYPSEPSVTPYKISRQTVHADAVAYVYNPGEPLNWQYRAVRIDTWLGKKWIIPKHYLPYVTSSDETIILNTYTLLFDGVVDALDSGPPGVYNHAFSYLPIEGMIAPQSVRVFEKYTSRNENSVWYHIRLPSGDAVWINPKLHMPASIEQESTGYDLTRVTSIHAYPFDYSQTIGAVAPQQVVSYERAGDWIHVHTWAGDGWLRVKDERPLNMTDAGQLVKVGVSPNPFPTIEYAGPVHTGLEGTIAVSGTPPYDRNDIQLTLEIYNDKGETQEVPKSIFNVSVGEMRNFFIMVSGNFNFNGAKVRLKSGSFKPAEDRSQDVYASISSLD
jgi:hypothetical protein